jgi:YegS/Rv2252/BmrU family lipid kinase
MGSGTANKIVQKIGDIQSMILIMCPTSKSGKGKRHWSYWQSCLDKAGVEYNCIETHYPGHACEIAQQADDTVIAVGGDGTINEVLNGILTSKNPQTMGVLYSGTSPDFCRFHNIPADTSESIQTLLAGVSNEIDVVKIDYRSLDNSYVTKYFACSCNIGLGADVARFANKNRKIFGDIMGTFLGLMRAIVFHKPHDLQVKIDGHEHFFERCNHLMIIKNPYIASGLKLQLDLKNNDGTGYVLAICNKSKIALLKLLPSIYTGKITSSKSIFIKPFTQIEVSSKERIEIEFDGDPQGYLPVKAHISACHLDLIGAANA